MAAGRYFLKNGVSRTSRWPFPSNVILYNDGKRRRPQSDREPKRYNQVR